MHRKKVAGAAIPALLALSYFGVSHRHDIACALMPQNCDEARPAPAPSPTPTPVPHPTVPDNKVGKNPLVRQPS